MLGETHSHKHAILEANHAGKAIELAPLDQQRNGGCWGVRKNPAAHISVDIAV